MVRFSASKILGQGTYSNSTHTAKRRWITEMRAKVASGTRVRQFTQGETLLACVETVLVTAYPTAANGGAFAEGGASLAYIPCLGTATSPTGTIYLKEASKTLTRIHRLHVLVIGPPDPARAGV